jgi:hypothetical protein
MDAYGVPSLWSRGCAPQRQRVQAGWLVVRWVVDQSNSWDSVLELIATAEPAHESYGRSSYLLLMLLELCLVLSPPEARTRLLTNLHRHLIQGEDDCGNSFKFKESIELTGWTPPKDWPVRILKGPVQDGICIATGSFLSEGGAEAKNLEDRLREFISRLVDASR